MADIVTIGIAFDTSQLTTGARQVQAAMQQVVQAETQAQTATKALEQSSTQAAQALGQERTAATQAASGTQQLSQASGQAASALKQTASAASSAASATAQVGQQAKTASGFLANLGSQALSFGAAQAGILGVAAAFGTVKEAIRDTVQVGLGMAQLRGSFAAISGGVGAGNREFQFAVKTANQLGLEVRSVAEQYRSLSAATRGTNLEGAATREIFTTLARAAQAYGLSTEQLGRASTALQQIISKGKVSMEELRGQLSEAIPGAMQIAARAYGTNTAALEEMIGKGVEASQFVRRFIAQLGTEVPPAGERAGKGIAQFGNEILLLKDRIAQSGLIAFLDSAAAKLATLLRLGREAEEKAGARAERRTERELGGTVTLDTMQAQNRQKLIDKTRELADAEANLGRLTKAREERTFGVATSLFVSQNDVTVARARVDTLKQEQEALKASLTLQTLERQELDKRRDTLNRSFKDQQGQTEAVDSANKTLKTSLDAVKKSTDDLNKSSALTPEIYGKINGTLQEQIKFYEARTKLTEASLKDVTEQVIARGATGAVPKELEAQRTALQEQYRQDTAAIERNKQALEDIEKAKRKAAQDEEERKRKATHDAAETLRLDEQQKEEVRRTHFQNIEALRRLEAQYTSVKGARDEDRASMLAASLATSRYADEATRLAQRIEAVAKAEEKLPELRSQAVSSAQALTEVERARKPFEEGARRRGESTEERLQRQYSTLAKTPGVEEWQLRDARESMQKTLETEQWDAWRDAGMDALHDITSEFAKMAFSGKLNFTDLANHAVEQLFRIASEATMNQLFKKGGWLEMGLNLGLKFLGIGGGAGGGGGGGLGGFTGGDFPGAQAGGPIAAGRPYWVGEAGPELIVPKMSGTVIPTGQAMGGPSVINVNVHGVTDVSSFIQSQGAVQRAVARTVSASYRGL